MDREIPTQDDENPCTKFELSPRKPVGIGVSDSRLKRDEWSEGAVTILLEAYESKWILRNRAKLKGQDWEDVAKCVSSRSCNSKSPKTQTQCKNKIESMKKRYRSESATPDTSSWPLYSRLDHLLRGTGVTALNNHASLPPQPPPPPPPPPSLEPPQPGLVLESFSVAPSQQPPVEVAENNSRESNDVDPLVKENEVVAEKLSEQMSDKNKNGENEHLETDSSTPALYSNENKKRMKSRKRKRRRRDESSGRGGGSWEDVAESIRWVADAVVRSEQARMDTMREVERMRVEAEAKRGEMDLKRTEIIANTQLEIARLFAKAIGKTVDSSLRIGRS
ncbi:hypothetical protein KSS87_003485 [Heliosperma pusillum]|nr:hypothetical protein KSS87_003485 [Heliosperma pusillum]